MKKGFFVIALALGAFLTSCQTGKTTDEPKPVIDSTETSNVTITTPSVDSTKEEVKPEVKPEVKKGDEKK